MDQTRPAGSVVPILLVDRDPVAAVMVARLMAWHHVGALHEPVVVELGPAGDPDRVLEAVGAALAGGGSPRLVLVYTSFDPGRARHRLEAAESVRLALTRRLGSGARCHALGVQVVTDPDRPLPRTLIERGAWSDHLVIDPVDRADPMSAGVLRRVTRRGLLDEPEGIEPVGALAAATLAGALGLWSHQRHAPIDEVAPGGRVGLRIVRGFMRRLDVPDPTDALLRLVLSPSQRHGPEGRQALWPAAAGAGRAHRPERVSMRTAELFVDHHRGRLDAAPAPGFTPPAAVDPPRHLWRWFAGYLFTGVDDAPDALAKALGVGAVGAGDHASIGAHLEEDADRQDRTVDDVAVDSGQWAGDDSAMWRAFVQCGLGLLDGSDLPAGIEEPTVGGHRVLVTDPAAIVPGAGPVPVPGFAVPARYVDHHAGVGPMIDPLDPLAALRLSAVLARQVGELHDDSARHCAAELDRWCAARRRSFAWPIGERIARSVLEAECRHAGVAAVSARPPLEPPPASANHPRVAGYLVAGALVALATVLLGVGGVLTGATAAVVATAVVTMAFAAAVGDYRAELEERVRRLEQHRLDVAHYRYSVGVAAAARDELERCDTLYWQWARWARVLRGVISAPFGEERSIGHVAPPGPTPDGLPAAVATAAATGRAPDARTVEAVRRVVFPRGWARTAWEQVSTSVFEELRERRGLELAPDPWSEGPRRGDGALVSLVERLDGPSRVRTVRGEAREVVERAARNLAMTLVHEVHRHSPGGGPVSAGTVAAVAGREQAAAFLDALADAATPGPVASELVHGDPPPVVEALTGRATESVGGRLVIAAHRVEFTAPLEPTALRCLQGAVSPTTPATVPAVAADGRTATVRSLGRISRVSRRDRDRERDRDRGAGAPTIEARSRPPEATAPVPGH